jgi:hypothetical protein
MKHRWLGVVGAALPALLFAQIGTTPDERAEKGPYARIAVLRPHDGHTVDFEAGYIRHLQWHRQANDNWVWYGWTVWAGERQRWFIYATFGHSAASLDAPVAPAEDERDNISNVAPHAEYMGNELYEYLPGLSRGAGEPQPAARLEFITVDLVPGAAKAFEAALRSAQPAQAGEALWYRLVAGGRVPRYVRLSPRPSLSAILEGAGGPALPEGVDHLVAKMTVEILNLRPTMCYGIAPAAPSSRPCMDGAPRPQRGRLLITAESTRPARGKLELRAACIHRSE